MAYTGNPSTNTSDALRLLIGDTSTSTGGEVFSDTEIAWFVSSKPNTFLAAEMALTIITGTTRGNDLSSVSSKKVGDLSITYGGSAGGGGGSDLSSRAKYFRMLGVRGVKPFTGGISESQKDVAEQDQDFVDYNARVGQYDYEAGDASGSTGRGYW